MKLWQKDKVSLKEVEKFIKNKFWYKELIPIIDGTKILFEYVSYG